LQNDGRGRGGRDRAAGGGAGGNAVSAGEGGAAGRGGGGRAARPGRRGAGPGQRGGVHTDGCWISLSLCEASGRSARRVCVEKEKSVGEESGERGEFYPPLHSSDPLNPHDPAALSIRPPPCLPAARSRSAWTSAPRGPRPSCTTPGPRKWWPAVRDEWETGGARPPAAAWREKRERMAGPHLCSSLARKASGSLHAARPRQDDQPHLHSALDRQKSGVSSQPGRHTGAKRARAGADARAIRSSTPLTHPPPPLSPFFLSLSLLSPHRRQGL